jgi:hypothetical protein
MSEKKCDATGLVRGSLEDPSSKSRTLLHHCTFIGMPAYFWGQAGTCSPDTEAFPVARVITWRTHAQICPSDESKYTVMSAGGFSPFRETTRPLSRLTYRSLWSDSYEIQLKERKHCACWQPNGILLPNLIQATIRLSSRQTCPCA